jgi:hypothetical protein
MPRGIYERKPTRPFTLEDFRLRSERDVHTGCWMWSGTCNPNGYGTFKRHGRVQTAHRAVFQLVHNVALPVDVYVCHRCDRRACVNPEHLFSGSQSDNMRDCSRKGRLGGATAADTPHPGAKLSADEVREIRVDPRALRLIASDYGVSKVAIANIKSGASWRSI